MPLGSIRLWLNAQRERNDLIRCWHVLCLHVSLFGLQRSAPMDSPAVTAVGDKNFTFRNMTRQDYFCLYDAIHTLVRQDEISKEEVGFPHSLSVLRLKPAAIWFADRSGAMVHAYCVEVADIDGCVLQENVLYDLIGRQDKGLAAAYQVSPSE